MRVRRALLFTPGDERRKIEKGATSGVDTVIWDCEDGVAIARKADARTTIAAALNDVHSGVLNFGRTEILVRVNAWNTGWTDDDLSTVLPARPDGIILPKVESADDIKRLDERINAVTHSESGGEVSILAIIESGRGIVNLREIAACVETIPRLEALIFGAEDFAGDVGAIRTPSGHEIAYGRAAVVVHAKAYGLQAVDMVHLQWDDADAVYAESRTARELGYTGKMAIHPKQIAPIQAAFTPSTEEIAAAQRLVDAFDAHQRDGRGAFQLDGKMVDMPIIRTARGVLDLARAAGLIA